MSEDFNSHGFRLYQRHGPIAYSFFLRSAAGGLQLVTGWPNDATTPEELNRIRHNFLSMGWERHGFPPQYPRLRTAAAFSSLLGGGQAAIPPEPPQPLSWRIFGVDGKIDPSRTEFASYTVNSLVFPYWMPAVLLSLLPVVRLVPMLRQRRSQARRARGLCPACGYDLRATPGRCPECGMEAAGVG